MRRRPGIGGLQTAAAARDQYRLLGENVAKLRTDLMKEQLSTFRSQLEDFARKHKNDIRKNPAFRSQFHEMCAKVGVDPLASNKGFWAELLGIGDFYYELGVQIVDICLATRAHNGGLIKLEELCKLLCQRRKGAREAVSEDDCLRAISKLKVLGSGFEVITVGKRKLVRSVPTELNKDHNEILEMDDCSTVQTLLEYNADCSAKDNEGMTPLNHLSQGPGNEKLRKLLNLYLEEQRKRKAIEACSQTKSKMDELENELSNIVGLDDLKLQLRKWAKGMLLDERRRALGLKVGARRPPHMAFLGNPGTGKTMVARILGKLLYMVGILPTDKVTEVQRTDLVGEFVGHTGPKTRKMIKEAEGGILFVDEAYRLIPMQKSDDKDYGLEALEEIMSVMDSGKIVVIFAGYSEPMKRVITSNEGFCRRVTKFFSFEDFSSEDLAKILHLKMNSVAEGSVLYGFKLHPSCTIEAIVSLIERETTEKQRREMNGGLVDPMLVNAREYLDLRLDFDCIDTDELLTITIEDLEGGLRVLSH